jgi:FkbM family methyltransferase
MRSRLEQNIRDNAMSEIVVAPVAVGESEGKATLHMGSRWDFGQASLIGEPGKGDVEVAVRPLADLARDFSGRFDAIKIDIEGFEDRALGSYLKTCADQDLPSSLVIEHLHQQNWIVDLEALAIERGYALARRTANNFLLVR